MKIEELIGETLTHIDVVDDYEVLLTTESGRQIQICHDQGCCESVAIEDTEGSWHDLIGKPILLAKHDEECDAEPSPSKYAESWTWTALTFKTNDATVVSRWLGESNGYYSESVDIKEVVRLKGKQ